MSILKAWVGYSGAAVVVMRCPPRPIYVVAWSTMEEGGSVVRKTKRGAIAFFDRTKQRLEMSDWPISVGPSATFGETP